MSFFSFYIKSFTFDFGNLALVLVKLPWILATNKYKLYLNLPLHCYGINITTQTRWSDSP